MPKFSIILPVRNGSNYIKECIESILTQTYPHFELLILENVSTDDTVEIINSFNDERIKIIPAEKPLNIEENWARALHVPKAEFMTLIGHDDILKPNFLETINGLIEKHPDATLYHTHFNFIDSKGKIVRACKSMEAIQTPKQVIENYVGLKADLMGTGFIMRSKDYDEIGGMPMYRSLLFADMELIIELARLGYMVVSPKECFSYRIHKAATTSSTSIINYIKGFEAFISYLSELKSKCRDRKIINAIETSASIFLDKAGQNIVFKILHKPKTIRDIPNMNATINRLREYGRNFCDENCYEPLNNKKIRLAKTIYDNGFLHKIFLLLRKVYHKPVFK